MEDPFEGIPDHPQKGQPIHHYGWYEAYKNSRACAELIGMTVNTEVPQIAKLQKKYDSLPRLPKRNTTVNKENMMATPRTKKTDTNPTGAKAGTRRTTKATAPKATPPVTQTPEVKKYPSAGMSIPADFLPKLLQVVGEFLKNKKAKVAEVKVDEVTLTLTKDYIVTAPGVAVPAIWTVRGDKHVYFLVTKSGGFQTIVSKTAKAIKA